MGLHCACSAVYAAADSLTSEEAGQRRAPWSYTDYDTVTDTRSSCMQPVDVNKLVKGRPLDNMEFMQWLKFYFEGRLGCQDLDYDPVGRRYASIRQSTWDSPTPLARSQQQTVTGCGLHEGKSQMRAGVPTARQVLGCTTPSQLSNVDSL